MVVGLPDLQLQTYVVALELEGGFECRYRLFELSRAIEGSPEHHIVGGILWILFDACHLEILDQSLELGDRFVPVFRVVGGHTRLIVG